MSLGVVFFHHIFTLRRNFLPHFLHCSYWGVALFSVQCEHIQVILPGQLQQTSIHFNTGSFIWFDECSVGISIQQSKEVIQFHQFSIHWPK